MKMKNLDKSCSEKRGLHENGGEKINRGQPAQLISWPLDKGDRIDL